MQGHKRVTVNVTVVDSIPTWEIKYLIFSLRRSGNEVKRGGGFRHSIHNANAMFLFWHLTKLSTQLNERNKIICMTYFIRIMDLKVMIPQSV